MTKPPSTIHWEPTDDLVAYCDLEAPLTFAGMEEGLTDTEALPHDLLWRATLQPPSR